MKPPARHAGNSRRQRNERADHRQHAGDEHCAASPSPEETICQIQLMPAEQNPAAIFLDQRTSAIGSDFVCDERSQIAANRARRRHPPQVHLALIYEITRKRHDQFRGERDARRLNGHQNHDAAIAGRGNQRADEDKNNADDFFSHGKSDFGLRISDFGLWSLRLRT